MEKENGNYDTGLYRDYCKDPCLHSWLTNGKNSVAHMFSKKDTGTVRRIYAHSLGRHRINH